MSDRLMKKKELTTEKMEEAITNWKSFQEEKGWDYSDYTSYSEVESKESRKTIRYQIFRSYFEFICNIPVKYVLRYMIEGHL